MSKININLTIAALAFVITDQDGNALVDYSVSEIKINADPIAFMKAGEEIGKQLAEQMESQFSEVNNAIAKAMAECDDSNVSPIDKNKRKH